MMEEGQQGDICRVCRSEGSSDKPLFYPCVCTGSIKFIHQDCLVQWLKYSRKEYCELCKHRFAFTPIYSPDMPKRLPIKDIISGLLKSVGKAIRYWFHYTLVAVAWLGVVPLTACRIYRCLFTGSVSSLLTLPLDMLSTDNLVSDCFQGCFVVTCTLCAFISLVWLREQILHGRGPDWLDHEAEQAAQANQRQNEPQPAEGAPAPGADNAQPAPRNNRNNRNRGANQRLNFLDMIGIEGDEDEEEEDEEEGHEENGGNAQNNAAQDDNWNPIEWDRAAEELTWERLLGLDGSLVFLEHVFWVVSLNTLFILVFAFCPYHIGHFTIVGFKFHDNVAASQFEGLLTTLVGYVLIAMSLVLLHAVVSIATLHRSRRVLGLCYIVVKVSLLVVVEIGVFPLICGWWLDICSLSMFDASLKDRDSSFRLAPGTSMFIHWLVGMVYVFYFASFILLLREVLRPGVLWFLRNLNDPDFNPIQEMIHLPIYRHIRRFLASMVIFGTTVLIMLWLPIRVIRACMPGFLPYNVMLSSDAPVSELSLELLLLQVVLPALLEQGHTRQWLKNMVRGWCVGVSYVLELRSYLLGDEDEETHEQAREAHAPEDVVEPREPAEGEPAGGADGAAAAPGRDEGEEDDREGEQLEPANNAAAAGPDYDPAPVIGQQAAPAPVIGQQADPAPQPAPVIGQAGPAPQPAPVIGQAGPAPQPPLGLGAAHQAMLQGGGPTGFQPYNKPLFFNAKLVSLMLLMCLTLFICSLVSYILPVYLGRCLMSVWMGETRSHELYTAACGLYTCWVGLRGASILYTWVPQGAGVIIAKVREWLMLVVKCVVLVTLLLGLVPLLLGLLFELVVVVPLRAPLNQTPVFFPWQDWALGVLHAKIICAVTMMGPQWWLKRVMEQVYNQGFRQMDLLFILTKLCCPVIGVLGMILALPYITARSIVPALGFGPEIENLVLRRIYPCMLSVVVLVSFCVFQIKQFKRLYEHIKNDKYLVGQRLVNYEKRQQTPQPPAPPTTQPAAI